MSGVPPRDRNDGRRWFVVHTLHNRELVADRHLGAQNFRTFLPTISKTVRHARRFRTVKGAFFPRYLFVELDLDRDRWRSVNGTLGVSGLIMAGERPRPVPAGVVEDLLSATNGLGELTFEDQLQPGQRVRVLAGPFAGRVGTLLASDPAGRVRMLLEIMGSQVPLAFRSMGLAPAA